MSDDSRRTGQPVNADSFSWWSWRPGIRPGRALLIGVPLMFVAFFFALAGIYSLFAIIIDSNSPPTRIPAIVTGYTSGILDNQPHLSIRLQQNGGSRTITPAITAAQRLAIHSGDPVTLDYSPHLRYLYALEDRGQRYDLPGGSPLSNLFTSIALIPLGLVFFPYPLLLTLWGWHDLRQPGVAMKGKIVGLRSTHQTRQTGPPRRSTRPGLAPRIGRAWYGVALEPLDTASQQEVMTFSVSEEQHKRLHEGHMVQMVYTPHLHYVLSIKPTETP